MKRKVLEVSVQDLLTPWFGPVVRQHIMTAVHVKTVYLMVGEHNKEEEVHFPFEGMPPRTQDLST